MLMVALVPIPSEHLEVVEAVGVAALVEADTGGGPPACPASLIVPTDTRSVATLGGVPGAQRFVLKEWFLLVYPAPR